MRLQADYTWVICNNAVAMPFKVVIPHWVVKMNKRKRDGSEPVSPSSKRGTRTMDSERSSFSTAAPTVKKEESEHLLLPIVEHTIRYSRSEQRAALQEIADNYEKAKAALQRALDLKQSYCEKILASKDAMEKKLRAKNVEMEQLREENSRLREKAAKSEEQELTIRNLRSQLDAVIGRDFDLRMKAAQRDLVTVQNNRTELLQQQHLQCMNQLAAQHNQMLNHLLGYYLPAQDPPPPAPR
ncbi:hypothetical protein NPX13_g2639 [Xylaria arbuscula]|uniref:Uncharacterized protein n=1 Tax=Xylaria arbuscula TaxID=114810 RepID=A0A9W8TQ59_9PEZI|nr:hypothetical protein NPX13_g2639 [Xylaria arbuscula]